MKILSILLLSVSFSGLYAVEIHHSPEAAYAQAVKSYVDGATQEINAIRAAVDAEVKAAPDSQKSSYEPVYKKLDRCDQLIADLKGASPSTFDKIKLEFENSRADANKALARARSR